MDISTVRDQIPIPDVLEYLGLDLPGRLPGHIFCPVHDENTPSFYVDDHHFRCFGCGVHGDAIDLVSLLTGCSLQQAVWYLAGSLDLLKDRPAVSRPIRELQDLGDELERATVSVTPTGALDLIRQKQWPPLAQLEAWGVRVGKYNLLIPHADHAGVVRGVKTRSLEPNRLGAKSSFTGSCFTTRLYRVLRRPCVPVCAIVEGESDCWTLSAVCGPQTAVYALPSGAMCWHDDWAAELRMHKAVLIIMDVDETGQKAAVRLRECLPRAAIQQLPAGVNDVSDAIAAGWRPPHLV